MRTKFLLLFLLISIVSVAQVPGYMGKRAVIGYSNYFMLGFKGPGPTNSGPASEASFTINNAHCLNFEYAYKQRKMICISGQYIRTGLAYDKGDHDGFFDFGSSSTYPYPGGSKYSGSFSTPALLRSINLAVGVKTFKNGFIAPTGRYRKIEVVLLFEKIKYDSKNFKVSVTGDPADDTLKTLGKGEYSYKNIAFAYTIGKQRILNDKFVLDFGIRFAYAPALNIITLAAGDEYTNNVESYFRRASNLRMARQQLVNIHLGIGFLAF